MQKIAKELLIAKGDLKELGINWTQKYLKRYPCDGCELVRHELHVLIDYQKLKRRRKLYTGGAGPYIAKLFLGRPI